VTVDAGTVRIATMSGSELELSSGKRVTVGRDGQVSHKPSPPSSSQASKTDGSDSSESNATVAPTPGARWSTAQRALDAGDRAAAEAELRQLLREIAPTEPLHSRASFMLAEIELARRSVIEARPRLETLLRGPDEQLAEDAASLLAGSYPTQAERALVWK